MSTHTLTTTSELDDLRRRQLERTVEGLRMAAEALERFANNADLSDRLGDVPAYMRTIRADFDALEALGYRECHA